MASITDYTRPTGTAGAVDPATPKKPRFRLFAALMAPFRDMDDRVIQRKNRLNAHRNNVNGSALATQAPRPAKASVRRFPRSDG